MSPGLLVLAAVASCAPAGRPLLAEILYDPSGADTGFEYVELYNPGRLGAPLRGARLEAGDGSAPGRWTLRWTGGPSDTIAAGGRFVIGGARVIPTPQAIVTLELQNGPDAVRLVWPDGAAEVVGWGALEFAEYACGAPAPDVAGSALARIPDDAGLGSNALDFRAAPPSPGRANQPQRDVGWVAGSVVLFPERPAIGEPLLLAGTVENRGRVTVAADSIRITARIEDGPVVLEAPMGAAIAPGDSVRFEHALDPLPEGKQRLVVALALAGDEAPENDRDSLRVRVGRAPLTIEEIQFHPAHGEGEWIELRNRSLEPLELDRFALSDRGTTRGHAAAGSPACAPESLAVLAQDRAGLLLAFPAIDTSRVLQVAPWPTLNNSNDESGTADAVVLRDADGVVADRVDYSALGVPAGTSLERQEGGAWSASTAPLGSPLAPPRPLAAIAGAFDLSPRRLTRAAPISRLTWSLPWPRARVAADLYALDGTRVGAALPEVAATARGEREWRPGGVDPGVYVLVFRARPESGGDGLSVSRVVRIERSEP